MNDRESREENPEWQMTIKMGTILFKDETLLPDALQFDSEPCATGWRLVKDLDGYQLNRRIHDAGWRFFCIAGEIKSSVFGLKGPKNRSEGCEANVGEVEVGQIQFFANHVSDLGAFSGSALCECHGLLETYPGKSVSVA